MSCLVFWLVEPSKGILFQGILFYKGVRLVINSRSYFYKSFNEMFHCHPKDVERAKPKLTKNIAPLDRNKLI